MLNLFRWLIDGIVGRSGKPFLLSLPFLIHRVWIKEQARARTHTWRSRSCRRASLPWRSTCPAAWFCSRSSARTRRAMHGPKRSAGTDPLSVSRILHMTGASPNRVSLLKWKENTHVTLFSVASTGRSCVTWRSATPCSNKLARHTVSAAFCVRTRKEREKKKTRIRPFEATRQTIRLDARPNAKITLAIWWNINTRLLTHRNADVNATSLVDSGQSLN